MWQDCIFSACKLQLKADDGEAEAGESEWGTSATQRNFALGICDFVFVCRHFLVKLP